MRMQEYKRLPIWRIAGNSTIDWIDDLFNSNRLLAWLSDTIGPIFNKIKKGTRLYDVMMFISMVIIGIICLPYFIKTALYIYLERHKASKL